MVYSIAVLPGHQGTGLGEVLLSFAETQALNKGYAEVRLYTNPGIKRNVSFYRHHGFVEIRTRPHPSRPGQNVVDMAKEVASGATAH
jgi:ribosomal protein S18 acetylase RimI-like enzyme